MNQLIREGKVSKTIFLDTYILLYEEVPFKIMSPVNNRVVAQVVRKFGIK